MKKHNFNFAIIIPSYNELKNIDILLERIRKQLPRSKIIIVDDSNPEENNKIRKVTQKNKNVTLISRLKKKGNLVNFEGVWSLNGAYLQEGVQV